MSGCYDDPDAPNAMRRRLVVATTVVGGAGLVASAVPFVASMAPSERARSAGAPVEADLSKLAPGQLGTVEWRGKPVWILRRTPENTAAELLPRPPAIDPSRILDCLGAMHPSGLRDFRAQGCVADGSRSGLAEWLLLSAPRIEVRFCRAGVQERAGAA